MDPAGMENQSGELVEIDKLFQAVMMNKWWEVVAMYKKSHRARTARLMSKSGDTALHIAVSNWPTEHALKLVDAIDEVEPLSIPNAQGNTPLHLAAMLGNLKICEAMVEKNPVLIAARNKDGETPIFLAASHGQQDIFFCLHQNFEIEEQYLRRNNGDTILHVAISGEYFSMALRLVVKHQNFVDAMNEYGLTPLHVLANKPNAFRSSTLLGALDRFIYYCLDIGAMERVSHDNNKIEKYRKHIGGDGNIGDYPENYKTCMNLVDFLLKKLCLTLVAYLLPKIIRTWIVHWWDKLLDSCSNFFRVLKRRKKYGNPDDEENPQQRNSSKQLVGGLAGGESSTTVGSDQRQDDAQAVPGSSTSSSPGVEEVMIAENRPKRIFPPNYDLFVLFLKLMMKVFLIIPGMLIFWRINEIKRKREQHIRATLVMKKLVECTKFYNPYGNSGSISDRESNQELIMAEDYFSLSMSENFRAQKDLNFSPMVEEETEKINRSRKVQTPILIAAKNGVTEMVEKILEEFPMAIQDEDAEQKNAVLLAVENRQTEVYMFLLRKENIPKESVFKHVDRRGNSALHLVAIQCEVHSPWLISGSALQMQWEIKWFQFVKDSMPPNFFPRYNKENKTPDEIFINTHKELIIYGTEWLTKTSESCSVVAALVATVAFATYSTIPGGINEDKGIPNLEGKPNFNAFTISSLAALSFSITALVHYLSIATSRYREMDFAVDLPRKFLLLLMSLFASLVSMLVAFCTGHTFLLSHELKHLAYPLYAALFLPITLFGYAQLPLYLDLLLSTFRKIPQRSYEILL